MPKPKPTTFGHHSFTYLVTKEWNSLPNFITKGYVTSQTSKSTSAKLFHETCK